MIRTIAVCLAGTLLAPAFAQRPSRVALTGRWDLTVTTPSESYPSWLEFNESSRGPQVRVVSRVSSVHAGNNVKLEGAQLSFETSEWFGKRIPVQWVINASANRITGTQTRGDGVVGSIVGVPQPKIDRPEPAEWSRPIPLLNGKDLAGWLPDDPKANHWKIEDGVLVNAEAGANLRNTKPLTDFKLHIEFNCPDGGNSGIYLRGRYEIQVAYEKPGVNDALHDLGAIYGFIAPASELPKRPGEWESFDVTFVGRTVTVVRNGVTTIDHQSIPGITGGALDSREGEPGFLYLQGDHTGGMKYRNITVSVPSHP